MRRASVTTAVAIESRTGLTNASPTALVNCTGLRLCGNPATQALWDNNTIAAVSASQNVWEFALEGNIPVIRDVPLVQSLLALESDHVVASHRRCHFSAAAISQLERLLTEPAGSRT